MTTQQLNWFRLALQFKGSVAATIYPRVFLTGFFGFIVSLLYYFKLPLYWDNLGSIAANVVFNLVLGLLLVFRTNTAYERFWEGRKNWGVLVVSSRNLARHVWVGVSETEASDRDDKIKLIRLLEAFAIATKLHLRQEPLAAELEKLVNPEQGLKLKAVKNPPLQLSLWIGEFLQKQEKRNYISAHQLQAMNALLDNLVEALTGCERIKRTPIPVAYAIYLKRLLIIYCLAFPFQLVTRLGWWTGAIAGLISFVILGIEEIGNEIEDPFGYDPNDLPLDEICQNLVINLEEMIGEEKVAISPISLNSDLISSALNSE